MTGLAVTLLLFSCSSHSVAPSPATFSQPQVFQGHGGGLWMYLDTDSNANGGIVHWRGTGITLISHQFNTLLDLSAAGNLTSHALQGSGAALAVGGPDGNLWITDVGSNDIQMVTPTYQTSLFQLPNRGGLVSGAITNGPDGALWFGESGNSPEVGRVTTSGQVTEFVGTPGLTSITTGSDGNLWGTSDNSVYRITTAGVATQFPAPGRFSSHIVSGSDGALYFQSAPGGLVRIATDGTTTIIPNPPCCPSWGGLMTASPTGKLWMIGDTRSSYKSYVVSYDPSTQQFSAPVLVNYRKTYDITDIAFGSDGNLYLDGIDNLVSIYLRQSITVTPTSLTIPAPGETANISVSETNYNGNWSGSSSDRAVATIMVGNPGTIIVTANGVGSCTITVNDAQRNTVHVKVMVL